MMSKIRSKKRMKRRGRKRKKNNETPRLSSFVNLRDSDLHE